MSKAPPSPVAWIPTDLFSGEELAQELAKAQEERHPALRGPEEEPYFSMWHATTRVYCAGRVAGSGFYVSKNGHLLTCAHVVDRAPDLWVAHWIHGEGSEFHAATLVAIDYSRDLAVLKIDPSQSDYVLTDLKLGSSPAPASPILTCGYPGGARTPRLGTGIVSGYDFFEVDGVRIRGPVLDASINPGNSGGPICTLDGKVVGITAAIPRPLAIEAMQIVTAANPHLLDFLNVNNGIAYGLDPGDARTILENCLGMEKKTKRLFDEYEPWQVEILKSDFVRLQREARSLDHSPTGPFSAVRRGSAYDLFTGWYNEPGIELDKTGWQQVLKKISPTGGSFMLYGTRILLYRQQYRGFICPVELVIR